ncbi:MAG: NCS2 family permease [Anaerorhabdus sp.]
MLEKLFKLTQKKTTVKTEILAGITTFLAMAYILAVNPGILGEAGMPMESVFFATAIASGVSSIIMGLVANYPIALAPGMGVNALFAYTACLTMGLSWQAALAAVFVSGVVFLIISITGLRKLIINSIPKNLKLAIGAGIGFFIAFIGFSNAGIIAANPATTVSLGNLQDPQVLLAVYGLLLTIVLMAKKVNAGVFWGLVSTAIVGIAVSNFALSALHISLLAVLIIGVVLLLKKESYVILVALAPILLVLGLSLSNVPMQANILPTKLMNFNFSLPTFLAVFDGFGELFSHPSSIMIVFSFLFVDFFDTAGTLVAVGNDIGLVNEKGEMEGIEKALFADSVGTVFGSLLGTSTITSFVESGSGVAAGARTGLAACTTGVLFLLSVFFSPLLSVITSSVTAPALIVVGILMSQQMKGIEWDKFEVAAACFFTIIMMVLCYSISDGIALGFIIYTLASVATGKIKDIGISLWLLDIIFLIYFII